MEAATARSAPRSLPDLPLLGFRNYWYPVLGSRQLGKRPVAVRLLGEDVVLFRSGGKLGALTDRCPHRGSQLSRGRILFPGTLSCGYHGWTFNPEGQCVAAIVEGPEARVVRKVRVTAYPAEERFGLVWVFLGEGDPPPLDEDLPPELQQAGLLSQFVFEDWACNWRNVTENYPDMLHAIYVHRTSLLMLFQKLPAWGTVQIEPLADGRGLHAEIGRAARVGDYPSLGQFPARSWWRVLPRRAANRGADVRMPGYIVLHYVDPLFGFEFVNVQWPVPIDEHRTRMLLWNVNYPRTALHASLLKAWFNVYYRHLHRQFVDQDRYQIEAQAYRNPEKLSASDVGVIQWRRFAVQSARQASLGSASNGQGREPERAQHDDEPAAPAPLSHPEPFPPPVGSASAGSPTTYVQR